MNQQSDTPSNTATPYVSVIVPAYNVAGYLERALDSALAQTMSDLEVIVVDDASSDTTFEVASSVAARDARVRLLRNENNRGPSASRNRAMHAARGEWIALLDGDDAWRPERLERMMAYAINADVISDDVYVVARSRTILPCVSPKISIFTSRFCGKGRDGYSYRARTICGLLVVLAPLLPTSVCYGKAQSNERGPFIAIRLLRKMRGSLPRWSIVSRRAAISWFTILPGTCCDTAVLLNLPNFSSSNHPVFR